MRTSLPQWRWDQWLSLVVLVLSTLIAWGPSKISPPQLQPAVATVQLRPVAPVPTWHPSATASSSTDQWNPQVSAAAVMVVDVPSGAVLYEKNAREARYPASTTKLMTALIARDIYSADQILTVKQEAFTQGTVMGLQLGEQIKVQDLLYGLLMQSGNDAAFVLANNHRLGYEGFVQAMNQRATALRLAQTNFQNPSGLDEPGHQTTARELALLARVVMQDEVLRRIVGTRQIVVTDAAGQQRHYLKSTNELLFSNPQVVGVKTGTTDLAGQVLVTQIERDSRQVVVVVMGSQDRYADTTTLLNWVFEHYQWQEV